jgi:hypothetical protein
MTRMGQPVRAIIRKGNKMREINATQSDTGYGNGYGAGDGYGDDDDYGYGDGDNYGNGYGCSLASVTAEGAK